jgi:hypothetical protein
MRRLLILFTLASLTACADAPDPTAPRAGPALAATERAAASAAPADTTATGETLLDALADAVERVGPTLGSGEEAAVVRAHLGELLEQASHGRNGVGARAALPALVKALDRLERADPALAPEIDAIRLALAPLLDAARMHKPF